MIDSIITIAIAIINVAILLYVISIWNRLNKDLRIKEEINTSTETELQTTKAILDREVESRQILQSKHADLIMSELKYKRLYLETKEELSKWVRDRDTTTGRFKKKSQH